MLSLPDVGAAEVSVAWSGHRRQCGGSDKGDKSWSIASTVHGQLTRYHAYEVIDRR